MGTEVLRPQDCLIRPAPSLFPRRKPNPNYHHQRSCRKPTTAPRPEPKKRREGSPKQPAKGGAAAAGSGLVMGQVTILKRGQSLDSGMARKRAEAGRQEVGGCRDLELFGTGRLGPDPSMIPKQIRVADLGLLAGGRHDVYAGTAFEQSPSPRALPLPRFAARPAVAAVNSSATEGLRRLLRLC